MQEQEQCPKCGGKAWYEKDGVDFVLRCMCGLFKVVEKHVGNYRVVHRQAEVSLPKRGTKISHCLGVVAANHPTTLTTTFVANESDCTRDMASSYLMMLMHKGLLDRVRDGKGRAGGSEWALTNEAVRRLRIA